MRNIILSLICLNFIACAEQTKTNSNAGRPASSSLEFVDNSSDSTNNTNQPSPNNNLQFTQIEGMWKSPCERGTIEYVQIHLSLAAGNYHQENQFHPDAGCLTKTKPPSIISGIYEVQEDVMTNGGLVAKKIDVIVETNGISLRIPDIVYIENNNRMYFGVQATSNVRPLALDFNYVFTK